jgi:hypothetical protein
VNGGVQIAQRYAVDWEQLDDASRIYVGPREEKKSYTIYGKEALAVARRARASVVDDLAEQTPGTFPTAIPITQADGNSIVLDLGKAASRSTRTCSRRASRSKPAIRSHAARCSDWSATPATASPRTSTFHVMDGPSPLASNGLPYAIDAFEVTGHAPSTAAFDTAEERRGRRSR